MDGLGCSADVEARVRASTPTIDDQEETSPPKLGCLIITEAPFAMKRPRRVVSASASMSAASIGAPPRSEVTRSGAMKTKGGGRRRRHESDEAGAKQEGVCPVKASRKQVQKDEDLTAVLKFAAILRGEGAQAQELMKAHLAAGDLEQPLSEKDLAKLQRLQQMDALKPKPYKHVRKNVFHESAAALADLLREDEETACQCVSEKDAAKRKREGLPPVGIECDENCMNRLLHIECSPATCPFAASGRCQNQNLTKRKYKKVKVFKTDACGFGVKALEDIKQGELVIELVGEVIGEEECEKRLMEEKDSGECAFYYVDVGGLVVDARRMGNEARFINHSCDPNCQMQKWSVQGQLRLGIFALRPISKDEELCYDYQFADFTQEPLQCKCGASRCRGLLMSGRKDDPLHVDRAMQGVNIHIRRRLEEVREAKAFVARLSRKPQSAPNSLQLFFNGRPTIEERAQGGFRDKRLFLLKDGPRRDSTAITGLALLSCRLNSLLSTEPPLHNELWTNALKELEELAARREATAHEVALIKRARLEEPTQSAGAPGSRRKPLGSTFRPYRRRGLETARKRRLDQALNLSFAKGYQGVPETWPVKGVEALINLVEAVREDEEGGDCDLCDMNDTTCSKCGGSGELVCCDGCTRAYHRSCLSLYVILGSTWFCPSCR